MYIYLYLYLYVVILSVVNNMCVPSGYACALLLHICVYSVCKRVTYTHGPYLLMCV